MFLKFKSNDEIMLDEYAFERLAWLSPYVEPIVTCEKFDIITTIELDSTFDALNPHTICIPAIFYRNSVIPLGILLSISKSYSSIFFDSSILNRSLNSKEISK